MHLTRLLENLLFPPALSLLLLLLSLGFLAADRRGRGAALVLLAAASLYLAAIPAFTQQLADRLQVHPVLKAEGLNPKPPAAIVVLAFQRYSDAPEYGGDTSSGAEMERLRYAARLHRASGLPIATIGGDALRTGVAGADLMADTLEQAFRVPVRWRDGRSRHTWDNARFAREILQAEGIGRVVLVTHAWHLRRAALLFEDQGFEVIPAPTAFYRRDPAQRGLGAWIPAPEALLESKRYLREWVGLALLALQRRFGDAPTPAAE